MGTTNDLDLEKWMMEVEKEEEAEDALATGLKSRPPRIPPPPAPAAAPIETQEEAEEVPVLITDEPAGVEEDVVLVAEPQVAQVEGGGGGGGGGVKLHPERSIYFDAKDAVGAEHINGTGGLEYSIGGNSVEDKKLGNEDLKFTNGDDIPKNLATEINSNSHTNLKDEEQPVLHPESSENGSASWLGADNDPNVTLLEESREEVAEWDVERVIDKQDTHDLYCPNCHSCITKRVILRKRKRRLPIFQSDSKREKVDVVQLPSLETNNQSPNTTLPGLFADTSSVGANDQDRDTGPDLFRCLSCFSFFIPAVARFKSFRIFGNRRERESAETLQQVAVGNTEDNKGGKYATHHDKEDAQGLESQNPPNYQKDQVSSVNGATSKPQEDREDFLIFSTSSQMMVQDHVEEASQKLTSKYPLYHQSGQLSSVTPAHTEVLIQHVNGSAVECRDVREDLVVSSTSVAIGIVKRDVKETPHGKFHQNLEDDKSANFHSISRDSSLSEDSHPNEQVNFSTTTTMTTTTTTTNVWNDEQNGQVSSTSVSIQNDEQNGQVSSTSVSIQNDEHNGQVSSTSVSIHHVDDRHKDASTRTEGGYYLMQDQSRSELSNPLPYITRSEQDKHPQRVNNEFIFNSPGISNLKLAADPKLPMSTDAGDARLNIVEQVHRSVSYNNDLPATGLTYGETAYRGGASRTSVKWDILKSVVYGGLVESVTSLGVVSSAAGGDATTLNIVALGLAYLIGGLFIIAHSLRDLKNEQYGGTLDQDESMDRYQEQLGRRNYFKLHATVAILSYILFGLVAPLTYGFSFRKTDAKEYKLIAVAAVSILCIILLAIGKVYVQKPPKSYIKTVVYYISIALTSSGLSYAVGMLIKQLLEKVGWFDPVVVDPVTFGSSFLEPVAVKSPWAAF